MRGRGEEKGLERRMRGREVLGCGEARVALWRGRLSSIESESVNEPAPPTAVQQTSASQEKQHSRKESRSSSSQHGC